MADWYKVRVRFDEPPNEETLVRLEAALKEYDRDFPVGALRRDVFFTYRSPVFGGRELPKMFLDHETAGILWLVFTEEDDPPCGDADALVFRPGVDPHTLRDVWRLRDRHHYLGRHAALYVELSDAFQVTPLPIRWEVFQVLDPTAHSDEDRSFVEDAVRNIVETSREP